MDLYPAAYFWDYLHQQLFHLVYQGLPVARRAPADGAGYALAAVTVTNLSGDKEFEQHFKKAAQTSGYQLALYDSSGHLVGAQPKSASALKLPRNLPDGIKKSLAARANLPLLPQNNDSEALVSYIELEVATAPFRYLRAAQLKDEIYAPIKTIRWIIYYGMFISIVLVIIVSIWILRKISKH